jgi:hypothetical protein
MRETELDFISTNNSNRKNMGHSTGFMSKNREIKRSICVNIYIFFEEESI